MLSQTQGCFDFPFRLTFQTKRQLTFIGFAVRRFTVGINYAIIIPSLWFYLESFNAPYYFLGLGIAADSIVGLLVAPAVGKICDITRRIKIIGSVTICLDIAGNIVYALPLHVYMPILGRCISGLGSGYVSALYGEVARVTTPDERTRIVTILEGVRLLGITIGPSFNLFLQSFDFYIGSWKVDKRTAPGFFMAIIWCLVLVIHLLTVYNLTKDYKDFEAEFHSNGPDGLIDNGTNDTRKLPSGYGDARFSDDDEGEEATMSDELTYFDILKAQSLEKVESDGEGESSFCQGLIAAFSRRELFVLFLTMFLMYFNQSSFEALAPLIGVEMLDFDITRLSILYVAAGVELVIVIVLVWFVSRHISDRNLLLSSVAMGTIGVFAQLGVALTEPHTTGCLIMGLSMLFFMLIATPITSIVGKSLLSKITPLKDQGLYQGLLASTQQLGLISGPLVGSAMFVNLTYFSSATLFILILVYMLTLSAMEQLVAKTV